MTSNEIINKAKAAQEMNDMTAALKLYQEILDKNPGHSEANYELARLTFKNEDAVGSLPFFKSAVRNNPHNQNYWIEYIRALIYVKRFKDAKNILKQAAHRGMQGKIFDSFEDHITRLPLNPSPENLELLKSLDKRGGLHESRRLTISLIQKHPNSLMLYNYLGTAEARLKNFEYSIEVFQQALALDAGSLSTLCNMALALDEMGNVDESIKTYKRALKIDPRHAKSLEGLADAWHKKGNTAAAIKNYEKAIRFNQESVTLYNKLGNVQKNKGDLNAAIENFRKALNRDPENPNTYNNLGLALRGNEQVAEAVESFKDGLKLNPRNLALSANLGNALVGEGSFLSSLIHFKNALDIDPENNAVWTNLTIPLRAVKSANTSIVREILDPQGKYGANAENVFQHNTAYKVHQASTLSNDTLAEALRCLRKAANRSIQNPKKISHQKKLHDYQNLIALIPFGRSGTGLMHSLIDGHPDVATLPSIYFSEFFDFQTWERITSGGWDKITERFVDAYPILFDARSRSPVATKGQKYIADLGRKEGLTSVGDKRNESLTINKSIFSSELKQLIDSCETLDALKLLKLIHRAHDRVLGLKDRKVLLYHIHNPDTYAKLNFLSFAPKAKWLMMVRDPIQSLESWIIDSFGKRDFEGVTAKIIFMFTEAYDSTSSQSDKVGLRLEDLKNQPKETIQALCDWMEIEDDPCLYEMTMQGKKWWGDPYSPDYLTDGMNPFGKKSISREAGKIFSERDRFILKTLFYPFNVRFGYVEKNVQKFKADLQRVRPLLDEPFEFEKKMQKTTHKKLDNFTRSGRFLYLKALLLEHWNFQNNQNLYPDMLKPLEITY